MAKIRKISKILAEDFPQEYSNLVNKLAFTLNPFLDNLLVSLDKRLNITDNLDGEVKVITVTPDNDLPLTLRTNLNFCDSVLVSRVTNLTNSTATLTGAPFVEFSNVESNGLKSIRINNITGLTGTSQYRIKLILLNE